jgi:hypothetical protein
MRGSTKTTVKFDASGLASGVYLYRMVVGSYVETQKFLLASLICRTTRLHRQEGSAFITGPLLFQLDQHEPAQVGKDQEMKVLKEMNELQEFENDVWMPRRE